MSTDDRNNPPLCPIDDNHGPMRLRHGSKGDFWGCSKYPACKGSMDFGGDRARVVQMYINMGLRPRANAPVAESVPEHGISQQPSTPAMQRFGNGWDEELAKMNSERMPDYDKAERKVLAALVSNKEAKDAKRAALVAKADKLTGKSHEPPKVFKPSPFQEAIYQWVEGGSGRALIVEALAGSGKTTTGVEMLKRINPALDVIFVAFNVSIAKELQKRVPRNVRVRTYHGLGFAIVRQTFGNVQVDEDKVDHILETLIDRQTNRQLFSPVKQIVSLVKANLTGTSKEELDDIVDHYGIELNGDTDVIYNLVTIVLQRCVAMTSVVDYDDMCWMPVALGLPAHKYDFLFVDEAQDTNKNQIALALMSIKEDGRIVAVGDRHQSVYGFRGADVMAIPNLIEALDADVLPLSITYRNPRKVVELVRRRFPDIPLECPEWAEEGIVTTISDNQAMAQYKDGDMVLCRTNAPLVQPAFALIRKGIKAIIRGRDIGKGLIVLVEKMKAEDMQDLLFKIGDYHSKEMAKLEAANKTAQAQALDDKVETIIALTDGIETIMQLTTKIEMIFSDDNVGVVFSSVHRAKGLEAKRVFVLHPELMPHPMAKQDWEVAQERNIEYVALTRTLSELYFVAGG